MKVVLALALSCALQAGDERLKELERDLTTGDGKAQRSAVIELAKLDTLEAWKLVIGALDAPLSQVADEAQLQVAAIDDDKSRDVLLGKQGLESKDALVRARVVESFARMATRPSEAILIDIVQDKDAGVRRTAAWTIERLADAGKLTDLWNDLTGATQVSAAWIAAADREKDPETCAALGIATQLVLGKPDAELAMSMAGDKRASLRAAAVLLAARLPAADGLGVARKLAADPALGVRLNVAEAFARWKDKPCSLELVAMLERERELRGRWRLLALLREVSGLAHRLDARPWRAWVDALPDDWHGEVIEPKRAEDEAATVSFAGLPVRSERVSFLIDLSGSVWQARKDGKTRKELIDTELEKALRALPAAAEFNVIPYTSKPIPWQPRLVPASEKNVAAAIEFFAKRKDTGTGNFWDAYLLALEDPRVDTVVSLSDGAPTGGTRWNLGLMRELMRERNRFRRVALDAVLADASATLKKHWVDMCADSGGRWHEIQLK